MDSFALNACLTGMVPTKEQNNTWMDDAREELATNPGLVGRIAQVALQLQRRRLEASEVRSLLELRPAVQLEALARTHNGCSVIR